MLAQTKLGTILLSPGCLQEPTLQFFFQFFNWNIILIEYWSKNVLEKQV